MLGAIIGDIVGSRWEFCPTNDYNFKLFSAENSYTDDTIYTVAVADAFEAYYKKAGSYYMADNLKTNHALAEFGVNGDEAGIALFNYLIVVETGGDAEASWQYYIKKWDFWYGIIQKRTRDE